MLLALLSDTHDNAATTRAALDLLAVHRPDVYLHAGDLVSPEMLTLFAGLPFHFIFGNNEYDLPAIRSLAHSLELHCHDHFGQLTFSGRKIALLHGHDAGLMSKILRPTGAATKFDYLIHGHTHQRRDERLPGSLRIINPGALQRARHKSVALLDLENDALSFIEVP